MTANFPNPFRLLAGLNQNTKYETRARLLYNGVKVKPGGARISPPGEISCAVTFNVSGDVAFGSQ
jgi:hypothetical protein